MFAVFTGTPGASKTLNMIKYVCEDRAFQGRQVYYYRINGCKIDSWIELNDEEIKTWYDLPEHSILVVDECQKLWRAGTKSDRLPDHLTRIEDHRHRGIDIVATCQSMAQLHRMVKVLVNLHRHYERPHGKESYICYEYSTAKENPSSETQKRGAIKTTGSFDKNYYDKYQSASDHTYVDRFPKKYYYYAGGSIIALISVIIFAFYFVKDTTQTPQQSANSNSQITSFPDLSADRKKKPFDLDEVIRLMTPLIENRPDTAPIYEQFFREAKDYPREQCIVGHEDKIKGLCRCYTQQGTRMNIEAEVCLRYVYQGYSFDHRREPTRNSKRRFSDDDARRRSDRDFQSLEASPRFSIINQSGNPTYPTAINSYSGVR